MNTDELGAFRATASAVGRPHLNSNGHGQGGRSESISATRKQEQAGHLFKSFFLAGFECSTHRLRNGKRLDLIASTRHDQFCNLDYDRLLGFGVRTIREGLRWHLIEAAPEVYDFVSAEPMVRASEERGIQVIWDLCHYGWPDDINIFTPEFFRRFVKFALASARWLAERTTGPLMLAPINEVSFFAWGGGDTAYMSPRTYQRGFELKTQLARCVAGAVEAIRSEIPSTRFVHIDPIINVVPHPNRHADRRAAEGHTRSQFQVWDMVEGRLWPQLGGRPEYLDIIGMNFYPDNQWIHGIEVIRRTHPLYRPLRELLRDVYERYHRPLLIAETGCEDADRPNWLRYVCEEVQAAMAEGVPLEGICLYPILNHPGWDNDRHCHNGLWDYSDDLGNRELYQPLAEELKWWSNLFEQERNSPRSASAHVVPASSHREANGQPCLAYDP